MRALFRALENQSKAVCGGYRWFSTSGLDPCQPETGSQAEASLQILVAITPGGNAMKHSKMLGLVSLFSALFVLPVGIASASLITSPTGTSYTGNIHAVHEGTHVTLDNPMAKIECDSTFELAVSTHGGGITAAGNFTSLTFSPCTNNWHVTVVALGTWQIHSVTEYNGALTSSGLKISATRLGVTCNYETNGTNLGTVTGGNPGRADIEASLPIAAGSSGLCGSGNTSWTGIYSMTGPVYIDPEF